MNNPSQYAPQSMHRFAVVPCGRTETAYGDFVAELADRIINRYEKPLLSDILRRNAEGVKPYRIREMLMQLPELSERADVGRQKRQDALRKDLKDYFAEYDTANIEGLVRFRLKTYQTVLEQTAEQLMDMHLAKREYEDFIGLLRYFVNVQVDRPMLAHLVVHPNGRYTLHNAEQEDITALCLSDFVPMGESMSQNADDLLISILITLAPKRLIIHGEQYIRNRELFDTVQKVFEKTEYCKLCDLCKTEQKH